MKRPFGRGPIIPFGGLMITMVINHLLVMGWCSKYNLYEAKVLVTGRLPTLEDVLKGHIWPEGLQVYTIGYPKTSKRTSTRRTDLSQEMWMEYIYIYTFIYIYTPISQIASLVLTHLSGILNLRSSEYSWFCWCDFLPPPRLVQGTVEASTRQTKTGPEASTKQFFGEDSWNDVLDTIVWKR